MYSSQNCRLQWSQTTFFCLWMWLYKSALLANTCKQTGHLFGRQCLERCLKRSRLLSKGFVHFMQVSVFFGFDAMAYCRSMSEITRARVFIPFKKQLPLFLRHNTLILLILSNLFSEQYNLRQSTSFCLGIDLERSRVSFSWGLSFGRIGPGDSSCGLPPIVTLISKGPSLVPSFGNWVTVLNRKVYLAWLALFEI